MASAILLVEDDAGLLETIKTILGRAAYSVIAAPDGLEALRKAREFAGDIELLLTDVSLPGLDGPSLAMRLMIERASIRVLLMSGGANPCPHLPFLKKPFRAAQLVESVRTAIDGDPPLISHTFIGRQDMVRAGLEAEVDGTRQRYLDAAHQFLTVIQALPTADSRADDRLEVRQATRARRLSFREYQSARRTLEAYIAADDPANQARTTRRMAQSS